MGPKGPKRLKGPKGPIQNGSEKAPNRAKGPIEFE